MFDTIVSLFLTHLEAEGKSSFTVDWHRECLRRFGRWLTENGHGADAEEWTTATVRSYLADLHRATTKDGRPLSPYSVLSYARSLRTFCRWLHADEITERDLMAKVKLPKEPRLAKRALSGEAARSLLDAAARSPRTALRDQAVLLFMLDTGARASEVCGLRLDAVDFRQRVAKVYGKGAKERYLPFAARTAVALQRYVAKERKGASPYLFESERGRALTVSGLEQLLRRVGVRAGVSVHPHQLRHTFAISFLRGGASVFSVKKVLGHASLEMTRRYTALLPDDIAAEHARCSPVVALLDGRHEKRRSG